MPLAGSRWKTLIVLTLAVGMTGPSSGQVYELELDTRYLTGCLEPSPCDCAATVVGPVSGRFELGLLAPPLGPIFEYQVLDFAAQIDAGNSVPTPIIGTGLLVIDVAADTQALELDLVVDGVPKFFASFGSVRLDGEFPDRVVMDVFHKIDDCLYEGVTLVAARTREFTRGDCNADGVFNIVDAIFELFSLFASGPRPPCVDACDADDDGDLDLVDGLAILRTLFTFGGPLPEPYGTCGIDPTPDFLTCDTHPCP